MNLRQPYEQLIADKLKKLPAPDADASWQQMKRLLDDEDIKTSAGKRPPGKGGWWRMGIIAIVLLTSLWLYVDNTRLPAADISKTNAAAPSTINPVAETKKNSSENINKTATIDKNTTLTGASATAHVKNTDDRNNGVVTTPYAATTKTGAVNNNINIPPAGSSSPASKAGSATTRKSVLPASASGNENTVTRYKKINTPVAATSAAIAGNAHRINNRITQGLTNSRSNVNKKDESVAGINHRPFDHLKNHTDKIKYLSATGFNNNNDAGADLITGTLFPVQQQNRAVTWFEPSGNGKIPGSLPANTSLLPADSIATYRNTGSLLNNETKKLVAKAQRDKAVEDRTTKEKKSLHLNLSNLFKPFSLHVDTDPRWAAGIAVNSSIPLNAQSRYNYNMNGKSGTLTDYIPSVYLQFHLNDYVFAQTEINFISPQYTPQLLVYRQNNNVTTQAGMSSEKSIYIQKLYYFNLPVSLHYSPVNNFYFSAGLQFSSFQSGLVSIQEKQYITQTGPDHPSSISNAVLKFKDDSIAAKLSPNEWRWQAGADYYWNRFTIGMRYNRSFKELLQANAMLPASSMRNESLIFFMRYNLFESRKKGEPGQKN